MDEDKKRKGDGGRNAAVDFLKAFAIVGVLTIHVSAAGFNKPDSFVDGSLLPSLDWLVCLVFASISRASVPIFLMCTGALMLDPEREVTLRKLWTRSIPRLLFALLFWASIYQLYHLVDQGIPVDAWMPYAAVSVMLFRHESHLYYLSIALLVYAFLPVLRAVAAQCGKKTLQYLLVLWAVVGLVYPTFSGKWPLNLISGMPAQYGLNLTYSSMGYVLLGWYVCRYAQTPWKWAAAGAAGYVSIFAATLFFSIRAQMIAEGGFKATFPGVALAGAGVCGWAFARFRQRTVPHWVTLLARASFCIYLSHMLVLYLFAHVGLSALSGPCILFVPATVAAVLACSLAVYFAVRRIPTVGRLLT